MVHLGSKPPKSFMVGSFTILVMAEEILNSPVSKSNPQILIMFEY